MYNPTKMYKGLSNINVGVTVSVGDTILCILQLVVVSKTIRIGDTKYHI